MDVQSLIEIRVRGEMQNTYLAPTHRTIIDRQVEVLRLILGAMFSGGMNKDIIEAAASIKVGKNT